MDDDEIDDLLNEPLDEEGRQDLARSAVAAHACKGKTVESVEYRRGELVFWFTDGSRMEAAAPLALDVGLCTGHDRPRQDAPVKTAEPE